jgi:hypothetical protein
MAKSIFCISGLDLPNLRGSLSRCQAISVVTFRGKHAPGDFYQEEVDGHHARVAAPTLSRPEETERVRVILRDGTALGMGIAVTLWGIAFVPRLFAIGSFAIAAPIFLLAAIRYFMVCSIRHGHSRMETAFRRTLAGADSHASPARGAMEAKAKRPSDL